MISNQKPWDDKKKPLDDKKKPLDIYYYLDFDDTYDIDFVERSIDLNVKVYEKDYNVNKITRYEYDLKNDPENQCGTNTIKRGLLIFNTMFKKLKLKIEPNYQSGVIHVIDASRSVGVLQNLITEEKCELFLNEIKRDYEK